MRRHWMVMATALAVASLAVLHTPPAYALCEFPTSLADKMDRRDGAFLGTSVKVEEITVPVQRERFADDTGTYYRTTFDVERVWKGRRSEELVVDSGKDFTVGGLFVVYGKYSLNDERSDYDSDYLCSGNARIPTGNNVALGWWSGDVGSEPNEYERVRAMYGNGHAPDAPPLWAQGLVGATAAGLAGFGVFSLVRWVRQKVAPP